MTEVVTLVETDRPRWERLFRAYMAFYERDEPQSMYDDTWAQLMRGDRIHALGVRQSGELIGITHFLVHPSTTSADVCFLSDLFTLPPSRGVGVGRALIEAVADWARAEGCCRVYWTTQTTNSVARGLYDQFAGS